MLRRSPALAGAALALAAGLTACAAATPAVPPPTPQGPYHPGEALPTLNKNRADIAAPKSIGKRIRRTGASSDTYQAKDGGPIGSITREDTKLDKLIDSLSSPVVYDRFVCTPGGRAGGGARCYVGLNDGTLGFQDSAGPENSVDASARFAAQALALMDL